MSPYNEVSWKTYFTVKLVLIIMIIELIKYIDENYSRVIFSN